MDVLAYLMISMLEDGRDSTPDTSGVSHVLEVDQRGGSDYTSIAAAVDNLRPGDTLRLAPGSGPYREPLYISISGTAEKPIVIEGNNEVVTGFEPLTGFREINRIQVCDLPISFPYVLTYKGERLRQNADTGQLTKYARLSSDKNQIVLLPGIDSNGWEISTRYFAVRIQNVSHHIYRNLKASGATNDGFNLHGTGEDLVFENIVGFQNLDEGFSAHDQIHSEIDSGEFYENDNGIGNVEYSHTTIENSIMHDNLGWGLWLNGSTGVVTRVTTENNGVSQVYLGPNAYARITDFVVVTPEWTSRQWISYKESSTAPVESLRINPSAVVAGEW